MLTITLESNKAKELLYRHLEDDLSQLHQGDAPRIYLYGATDQACVVCELSQTDSCRDVQIYYLASSLTDFIVNHYEPDLLIRLINRDHPSSTRETRLTILSETQAILRGSSESRLADEACLQSKAKIMYALLDYLNAEPLLILHGFARFRLWEYRDYLRHLTRMAAESIRRKRAHREFITLLKSFVKLQEPSMEVAHVIVRPNGLYRILDRDYSPVETEYLEGFAASLAQHELDMEDLLISALLTLAPIRIILHFPQKWLTTGAIHEIYSDRTRYCPGCRQCEESRKAIAKVMANRARKS
ncbi:MAG: hypothetical protein GX977_14380 [Firmicutes bacterium]|nr:hypothetical protein [Bacillota bacterium]